MNTPLALLPISLILLGIAVAAFIWAVKRGQFDDLETPALDILRDDPNDPREPQPRSPQAAPPDAD